MTTEPEKDGRKNERTLLAELLSTVSSDRKYFVQIGRSPRTQLIRSVLSTSKHWTGMVVNERQGPSPKPGWRETTAEEVVALMQQGQVSSEPDLLIVDVTPNSFHILLSVLRFYSPRIVVANYDASLGAIWDEVVPHDPFKSWDRSLHRSTSFSAFSRLADVYRYTPLRCFTDKMIPFVRNDISRGLPQETSHSSYQYAQTQRQSGRSKVSGLNSSHYLAEGVVTVNTRYGRISYFSNDEFIGQTLASGGYWQDYLLAQIKTLPLETDGIALDIGAHVGTHSIAMARLFPALTILSFEPQQPLFKLLQRNIWENDLADRVVPIHAAVGAISGTAHMSRLASDGISAGLTIEYGSNTPMNLGGIQLDLIGTACEMLSIDSLNLEKVVYAKIDVEGAEPMVLEGMKRTIQADMPVIVCENRADRALRLDHDDIKDRVYGGGYSPLQILSRSGYRIDIHGDDLIGVRLPSHYIATNKEPQIPQRIFQTWKTKTSLPDRFAAWSATFMALNPTFEYELWDDSDNRNFIASEFPWFLQIYDEYPSEIFRVDAVRYFYLYSYGGFYIDLDTECLKPLEGLLEVGDVVLGRMGTNPDFNHSIPNAIMASRPKQEFWLYVVARLIQASRYNDRPEVVTGPVLLKDAADLYLASESVWGDSDMAAIASKLRKDQLPSLRKSSVTILESRAFYPLDWSLPSHQALRSAILAGQAIDTAEKERLCYGSYTVTYWTHTWE